MVTGDFEALGNVVLGNSEEDNIVLGGTIQNWNVPIVKGISDRFSVLAVSVFDHGLQRGTKIVLYNVRNGLDINHAFEIDRPNRNSFSLKYFNGIRYVPSIPYTILFSDTYVLPIEYTGHTIEEVHL